MRWKLLTLPVTTILAAGSALALNTAEGTISAKSALAPLVADAGVSSSQTIAVMVVVGVAIWIIVSK